MPRFVIDLGDIELSKEATASLSEDLQKVALGYVAGLRFDQPFAVRFPPEWLGLILRRDFDVLMRTEKELGRVLADAPIGRSR